MIDFTKVPNIHYWTQRVLPCVFDESLSYVEKINKLEEEINKLIGEYNTFGQNVVSEINTFEGETTNQINAFIQQITNEINTFKSDITNQLNTFETSMTNKQNAFEARILQRIEDFETTINNSINAMQAVVNDIPNIIEEKVNTLTIPYLQQNVPSLVETQVAQNVNKVYDLTNSDVAVEFNDNFNLMTNTGIYFGKISAKHFENAPFTDDTYFYMISTYIPSEIMYKHIQYYYSINANKYAVRRGRNTNSWLEWETRENYIPVKPASVTDLNTLDANTIYCTYLNTETFTNYPSDIPNNAYIEVMTNYRSESRDTKIQFVKILYTPNTSNIVGDFRYRYEMTAGTWSTWARIDNYQFPLLRRENNSSIDTFTQTGIYYAGGESGANWGGTIPTDLEQGKYYMQTVANSGNEIIQTIVNGGNNGNSLYTRMKYGTNWGEWQGISRRELLWSGVSTVTNTRYAQGVVYATTTGVTNVEIENSNSALSAFVASHEVNITVANTDGVNIPVAIGHTIGMSTDEITGKNVVTITVLLENNTSASSTSTGSKYYVAFKLYKVNNITTNI